MGEYAEFESESHKAQLNGQKIQVSYDDTSVKSECCGEPVRHFTYNPAATCCHGCGRRCATEEVK